MKRQRVDPNVAQQACDAVRDGHMTLHKAAATFGISRKSISRRLNGECAMDAKVGSATVLSADEEEHLKGTLRCAADHRLCLARSDLIDAVRKLCNDGRRIPWDPDKGPGRKWINDFLRRHPELSERSSRIFDAKRFTNDEEYRAQVFFKSLEEYAKEHNLEPNHVWIVDETGKVCCRCESLAVACLCKWCGVPAA